MIRLGIVTVHLQDFTALRRTLASLEVHPPSEWIVIDGGSSPVNEQDAQVFGRVKELSNHFVSESDEGIYDAMNKGTRLSQADYVLFLNAGDCLHQAFSLTSLAAELGSARPQMIWGTCYERFTDGRLVKLKNRTPRLAWYGIPVNHQNVLFRRDVLGDQPYDTRFRYCADYDLICRVLLSGGEVQRTDMPISVFERGGVSAQNFSQTMREEEILRCHHFRLPRSVSGAITVLKKFNHEIGRVPAVRRLMRKWV